MTHKTEPDETSRHKYSVLETATGILSDARQNGSNGWSEDELRRRIEWLRWRVEQGWESFAWPRNNREASQVDDSIRAYARAVLVLFAKAEPPSGYRDNARNIEVEFLRARVAELEAKLREAKEPMRVKVWPPNEATLAAGLVVGATVRLPDGRLDVVVAYDGEGDPVVQGYASDAVDNRFNIYYVKDLVLVPSPPRKD